MDALPFGVPSPRLDGLRAIGALDLSELRDKNLACWCEPGEACHADVLLEMANEY